MKIDLMTNEKLIIKSTLNFHLRASPAMEMIGFEPTASALQGRRSPN
jgi:hypothetical protein